MKTQNKQAPKGAVLLVFVKILTHRLHLDEALAIVLLLLHGWRKGIDVTKAKLELVLGNKLPGGKTWQQLEEEKTLCIGEGNGRFDEHGVDASSSKGKKCAALLVAEHLGVAELYSSLVEEVRDFDREAEATKTTLGTVMKDCFISRRRSVSQVMAWAISGVVDMVVFHSKNTNKMALDYDAYNAVFLRAWTDVSQQGLGTPEMYERMSKTFHASKKNEQCLLTELSYVYYYRVTISGQKKADEWLYEAAVDMLYYQAKWMKARDEFLSRRRVVLTRTTACVDGRDVGIRVAVITGSNSEVMDKVFRSAAVRKKMGPIDVLLQKKPSGNVCVFLNHPSRLPSDDLARMLRWMEVKCQGRTPHRWESLAVAEDMPGVEEWYYHRTKKVGASAFYNGSLSHPDVRPSQIPIRVLAEMICYAFHPDGVKWWRRKHEAFDLKPAMAKLDRPRRKSKAKLKETRKMRRDQKKARHKVLRHGSPKIEPRFANVDKIDLGGEIDAALAAKAVQSREQVTA